MTPGVGAFGVTTASIDYLRRADSAPPPTPADAALTQAHGRLTMRVRSIGRYDKRRATAESTGSPERWVPPTGEMLTGAYGEPGDRIPLAFSVRGTPEGLNIGLGTWWFGSGSDTVLAAWAGVLESLLGSLYPAVEIVPDEVPAARWPLGGLVLGTPTAKPPRPGEGATPWDRVVRSMQLTTWEALVLAYPVGESGVRGLRDAVLNEIRAAETVAQTEAAKSPLVEHYVELLTTQLEALDDAAAVGAWRTAVYLLGDATSYPRLRSVWRSVFAGPDSRPEPIRVFARPDVPELAAAWAMSDLEGVPAPSRYRRPLEYQTILPSGQLAAYIHFPEMETAGFSVQQIPRFDVSTTNRGTDRGVVVGQVVAGRSKTADTYAIGLRALTRHTFVAGVTGSGKTNTILSLLEQIDAAGVPFLVIEPAKREYRGLLNTTGIGPRLRVFTAGEEGVSPLRMNPFEIGPGTTVASHLDLLRSVFSASFGLWTPLPQVLERCLYEVYADKGWELRTNVNRRLPPGESSADAFPTLSDLAAKVAEVVPKLGYDEKIASDIRAALTTRLESLRVGGKGAMFDVSRSLPLPELLEHPTVLELEGLGDESDKAFLMGLLFVRLAEHRRAQGPRPELTHILVFEEAHRLLANVAPRASEEMADPRGHAVEAFANLLSEIRAYGQGVLIADQVPVRLAPDVIKNTNLKVAHRVVAEDDRTTLGAAMAMDEMQTLGLAVLEPTRGEAAVFSEGDDVPMLVSVPLVKDGPQGTPPADAVVAERMAAWRTTSGLADLYLPRAFCAESCTDQPQACEAARKMLGDPGVQQVIGRVALSCIEDTTALDRVWEDVVTAARSRRPPDVEELALLRSLCGHGADWLAQRRGAQSGWSYVQTEQFTDTLRAMLLDKADGTDQPDTRTAYRDLAWTLLARTDAPYPACDVVCTHKPSVCLYRAPVADLVASRRYREAWRAADAEDAVDPEGGRAAVLEVCEDAASELVEFPEPEWVDELRLPMTARALRVCLCFEQQMLADDQRKPVHVARVLLGRTLREAGVV